MATIRITADGQDEFNRTFTRLDASFDDLTPIWPDVRDKFWEIEKRHFDSEGSAGKSGKWEKLSPSYNAQKIARYGPGLKILEATGDMMRSLTSDTADTYYRTTKKDIAIGTTLDRAVYHHRGAGRLPKREVISFGDQQQREMMKVIQVSLVREFRKGVGYLLPRDRKF